MIRNKRLLAGLVAVFALTATSFPGTAFANHEGTCACYSETTCQTYAYENAESQEFAAPPGEEPTLQEWGQQFQEDCEFFCQEEFDELDMMVTGVQSHVQRPHGTVSTASPLFSLLAQCQGYRETKEEEAAEEAAASTADTPPPRQVQEPTLSVPIPDLSFSEALEEDGVLQIPFIADYINGVYRFLTGFSITVATVMLIIGGLQYTFGAASQEQIAKAKTRMTNAVAGLSLLLGTYLILFTVNPELVALKAVSIKGVESVSTENTDRDVEELNLSAPDGTGTNGVPYFSQRNYDDPYGGCNTIKSAGCGPTSTAMVLKFYGADVDPKVVADSFADEGYRACGPGCTNCKGTAHVAFTESSLIEENGLVSTVTSRDRSTLLSHLRENEPLIVSVGPSMFTTTGHFIVLTGVDDDGNILLNDPNSNIKSAAPDEVFEPIKGAWLIKPPENE